MVMQVVILQNNIYKLYIRNFFNYYMKSIIVYVAPPMEYFTEMIPTNVLMCIYIYIYIYIYVYIIYTYKVYMHMYIHVYLVSIN